jgi:ABC-2 type transport system permease protein
MTTLTPRSMPGTAPVNLLGAIRSEWTKLRTVRSTLAATVALLGLVLGLTAIFTAASMASWDTQTATRHQEWIADPIGNIFSRGLVLGQLSICVLGVLVVSSEYATGTIRTTFQSQPRRLRVLTAKVAVFGAFALVLGEVLGFADYFVSQAVIRAHVTVRLSDPGVFRAVLGSGLYLGVLGLFSLAVATILRRTAAAITVVVAVVLVLAQMTHLLDSYDWGRHLSTWWPTNAGALIYQPVPDPTQPAALLTPWQGFAVFTGWTAVLLAIGAVLLSRRDA